MPSDRGRSELREDFPELDNPDVFWAKELYSHFGLLFSGYALLEASLHGCHIHHQISTKLSRGEVRDPAHWTELYGQLEIQAYGLTLGNLIKSLEKCDPLREMLPELRLLKAKRDYFAHHFFRDELRHFGNDTSIGRMISSMNLLRRRVKLSEERCHDMGFEMIRQINPKYWDGFDLELESKKLRQRLDLEAQCLDIQFGWEKE